MKQISVILGLSKKVSGSGIMFGVAGSGEINVLLFVVNF